MKLTWEQRWGKRRVSDNCLQRGRRSCTCQETWLSDDLLSIDHLQVSIEFHYQLQINILTTPREKWRPVPMPFHRDLCTMFTVLLLQSLGHSFNCASPSSFNWSSLVTKTWRCVCYVTAFLLVIHWLVNYEWGYGDSLASIEIWNWDWFYDWVWLNYQKWVVLMNYLWLNRIQLVEDRRFRWFWWLHRCFPSHHLHWGERNARKKRRICYTSYIKGAYLWLAC